NPIHAREALSEQNIWAPAERQKVRLIERIVEELAAVGVDATESFGTDGAYGRLVESLTNLSKERQLAVRKAIEPDIAELASTEFELIMKQVDLGEHIREALRPDILLNAFDITLVD